MFSLFSFISAMVCGTCQPNLSLPHPTSTLPNQSINNPFISNNSLSQKAQLISAQTQGLDPKVTQLALKAMQKIDLPGFARNHTLTIIDYSKPSTQRRFWVVDVPTNKVIFQELVAHGKNSGRNFATTFSDKPGSLKSSIGVYLTDTRPYLGHHGYSLRLNGLEQGFNEQAQSRAIVVHGAAYVSEQFARQNGRLGLSWGCPALRPQVIKSVIDKIKGGSVVFAYYPDQRWLRQSKFLNA